MNSMINNIKKLLSSPAYPIALAVTAALAATFDLQAYFIVFSVAAAVLILLLPDRQTDIMYLFAASSAVSFTCYGRAEDFSGMAALALPLGAAIVFNIVFYRARLRWRSLSIPSTFVPLAIVAVSILVGGLGLRSAEDYLSPFKLYYWLGLSVGLVAAYLVFRLLFSAVPSAEAVGKIIGSVLLGGAVSALIILIYYVIGIREVATSLGTLSFLRENPLRNQMAQFLIPSAAIALLRSRKSRAYIPVAILIWLAALLSSSRSALLYTTVALIAAGAYLLVGKLGRERRVVSAVFGAGLACVALIPILYALVSSRMDISSFFTGGVRFTLWKRGLADFFESPIFGQGIVYSGNARYAYASFPFEMEWYHNAVIQILCGLGIVGAFAYGYQAFSRIRAAVAMKGEASKEALFVYCGAILLSMTEPGIFCPVPTALLLVILFASIDRANDEARKKPRAKKRR